MFLDLSTVKASTNEALPAGTYTLKVDSAEVKNTKAGDGQLIEMWLKVASGTHEGRKIVHRFNIKNKTPKAQEIGLSDLKNFLLCSGHSGIGLESVSELVGKTVEAKTVIERDDKGNERAAVKSFIGKKTTSANAPVLPEAKGF